ncbi:hypothetical protein JQ575_05620 [Bradyrhizobium sp. JYMT SZCCT0428]|nr:hypothetical protein [Bradyrhizobium sp. JYMT SZCCT0428]
MRPLSQTLNDLIGFAEETVTRPNRYSGHALGARFGELAAEIRGADARPAEAVRTTRAAMVMVYALEGFYAGEPEAGSRSLESPWLMLAGAALPLLRVEAWIAFNNEKAARGT